MHVVCCFWDFTRATCPPPVCMVQVNEATVQDTWRSAGCAAQLCWKCDQEWTWPWIVRFERWCCAFFAGVQCMCKMKVHAHGRRGRHVSFRHDSRVVAPSTSAPSSIIRAQGCTGFLRTGPGSRAQQCGLPQMLMLTGPVHATPILQERQGFPANATRASRCFSGMLWLMARARICVRTWHQTVCMS